MLFLELTAFVDEVECESAWGATDVAHNGAQRWRHNAVFDLLKSANRSNDPRCVRGVDLHDDAYIQRNPPTFRGDDYCLLGGIGGLCNVA